MAHLSWFSFHFSGGDADEAFLVLLVCLLRFRPAGEGGGGVHLGVVGTEGVCTGGCLRVHDFAG